MENEKNLRTGIISRYNIPIEKTYDRSVMDAVPSNLQKDVIDFTDAVFGRSTNSVSWASRVFFEDAIPNEKVEIVKPDFAHPLMQPNPTAFQLYLCQN